MKFGEKIKKLNFIITLDNNNNNNNYYYYYYYYCKNE